MSDGRVEEVWSSPRGPWLIMLAAVGSLALAACSGSAVSGQVPTSAPVHRVRAPVGWSSYSYGDAEVSVPGTWVVRRSSNCPDAQAPGTLLLGVPKVIYHCPEVPGSASYVVITSSDRSSSSSQLRAPGPLTINGVSVDVGFSSPLALEWDAPSLDVQIEATGPLSTRILHTLRRDR